MAGWQNVISLGELSWFGFRISGLVLLIAGALALLLIPMWGRHIALASFALIIVGAITLAARDET